MLQITEKTPGEMHSLISGCVGVSTALEFEHWCNVYDKLPNTADILAGTCTMKITKTDVIYALTSSLLSYVAEHNETIRDEALENICRYVSQFQADFSAMFFRGMLTLNGMNLRLTKSPSFSVWMKKNRRFL